MSPILCIIIFVASAVLSLASAASKKAPERNAHLYKCSFCITSASAAADATTNSGGDGHGNFQSACESSFSRTECEATFGGAEAFAMIKAVPLNSDSRKHCFEIGMCPSPEVWSKSTVLAADGMDIRISKAIGSRGYNKIRVSAITNSSLAIDSQSVFQYSAQFKYRWTDKYLSSAVVDVVPGQKNSIRLSATKSIEVFVPRAGDGVRGVIFADPCFQSKWIVCAFSQKFQMFNHTIELLNAINSHDDVHYWQILGDNFYDQDGEATSTWFNSLSEASKTKIFHSVPGNHDFWVNAAPNLWVPNDQQGNGFMQFYGQDVIASTPSSSSSSSASVTAANSALLPLPYDFSVDPDGPNKGAENLPTAGNFFFYNSVGNTGFIGFSGAHSFDQSVGYFEEACSWASMEGENLQTVLLLGHWDFNNDGCDSNSSTPAVFKELLALPACSGIASKLRYMVGHKHCNKIWEQDVGFMVGANGMEDYSCFPAFGIPIVDTTGGRFRVFYFPVNDRDTDNYNTILSCIQTNGASGCYHLAVEWTTSSQ